MPSLLLCLFNAAGDYQVAVGVRNDLVLGYDSEDGVPAQWVGGINPADFNNRVGAGGSGGEPNKFVRWSSLSSEIVPVGELGWRFAHGAARGGRSWVSRTTHKLRTCWPPEACSLRSFLACRQPWPAWQASAGIQPRRAHTRCCL